MTKKTELDRQHEPYTQYDIVKYREETETGTKEYLIREYMPDPGSSKMIQDSFTYVSPKPDQVPRYEEIRAKAKELADLIAKYTPPGRERSASLTQLQLSVMLANAAIACGER